MSELSAFVLNYPVGSGTTLDDAEIKQLLNQAGSWDQRYRQLLLLAKSIPSVPDALKHTEFEVHGCESKTWLLCYNDQEGRFHFAVDSESRIVKALAITILAAVNHQPADMICKFQVAYYLEQLGFQQHITPSRANGLLAVWKKMSDFCAVHA